MAYISIKDLSVEFRIYGTNSRSLKKRILSQATGGKISGGDSDAVTVKALDNINLEIQVGDRIGLVGHNGAGKSTLLKTIAGIYKPSGGSIEISGKVSALLDPSAGMDPEATGIENIFLRGYVLGMTKKEIDAKIDDIANFTELGDFLELPVKTYSAGMFSRLGFAISTSTEPDILLVDEGIGAGDASFVHKVQARIKSHINKSKIFILASHDQSLINELCNQSILFERGQITRLEK